MKVLNGITIRTMKKHKAVRLNAWSIAIRRNTTRSCAQVSYTYQLNSKVEQGAHAELLIKHSLT